MPDEVKPYEIELENSELTKPKGQPAFGHETAPLVGDPENAPHCPECGYNLYGLPQLRCPECGYRARPRECVFTNYNPKDIWRTARREKILTIIGILLLAVGFGITVYAGARGSAMATIGLTTPLVCFTVLVLLYEWYCSDTMHYALLLLGTVWLLSGVFLLWLF